MISQVVKVADDYVKSKTNNQQRTASVTKKVDEIGQLKYILLRTGQF